ncbi:Serine/threonine-protein kinase haspin [Sarcoptes scabiei]|nr:Serine/threonine-protein kinase haspin [Sarcoptes scabiei]UXI15326.1 DNA repair protein complementing XP-C cells [Sarcoptes scabiei]
MFEVIKFKSPVQFDTILAKYNDELQHIGSGSYADVYGTKIYILKSIRLMPQVLMNRIQSSTISRTTSYLDAFNEFQISWLLSKLQQKKFTVKNQTYGCQIFPKVICCYLLNDNNQIVKQKPPKTFSAIESIRFDIFDDFFLKVPRENLIIVMENGGRLLSDVIDQINSLALISILKQIIVGMMIAEFALEFEHRDLHSGNILVKDYKHATIKCQLNKKSILIPSHGYQVKLIDTTFSRLKYKDVVYFKDMTSLFENFDGEESGNKEKAKRKMQDFIYEQMAQTIKNDWSEFFPKTNVLWIKYVIYKLQKSLSNRIKMNRTDHRISSANEQNKRTLSNEMAAHRLMEEYNQIIDKCSSSYDFFRNIINRPSLNNLVPIMIL